MAIASRDEEIAFFVWRCPDRGGVRIDQGSKNFREDGLGRTLLAGYGQQRVGPAMS
jgi:hypothetical protein